MTTRAIPLIAISALLAGCSFAPAYHVPTSVTPTSAFRVDPGWVPATPSDAVAKGEWWRLFNDDTLNTLEARVIITNQNIAYYRAAYRQALATVRVDQAAMLPTVGVTAGATRQGTFAGGTQTATTVTTGTSTSATYSNSGYSGNTFTVAGTASWAPDLWGALANTTRGARATAEASAAQIANAALSAQGTLATTYFSLRGLDAQAVMLDTTIASYRRALQITKNKQVAGTASAADVDTAQSQLSTAEASRRDLDRQRVADETAIAVLVGESPSTFQIAKVDWHPTVPAVPGVVPSALLERRPDVANNERLVQAANYNIGVQRAAFFPSLSLNASVGENASSLGNLFSAASSVWSLGASAAETVLDWGARSAKVAGARAAYDQAVATYRQTVLGAFQEVEQQLAAVDSYRDEDKSYRQASTAADNAEKVTRNEYQAGTVDFTTVTTAEATAYAARVNLIQNTVNQQNAAVGLIQGIGGQWTGTVDLHPSPNQPKS